MTAPAAAVDLVRVDQLLERLDALRQRHADAGRLSHSLGVASAIALIKRDVYRSREGIPPGPQPYPLC